MGVKTYKCPVISKSWGTLCRMATIVNNIVLHTWKLLREEILKLIARKENSVTVYGDGC